MITKEEIQKIDSNNMFDVLKNFPSQVASAIEIGKSSNGFAHNAKSNDFAILGMGGSAIGGDILKTYASNLEGAKHLRFSTYRGYDIPGYITPDTNVIASSYSGETEETISAFEQVKKISQNMLSITTGGKLSKFATDNSIPVITVPTGFQPRCALGFSFFPMLISVMKSTAFKQNAIEETELALKEIETLLLEKSIKYSTLDENNFALDLAKAINGKMPIIYSSSDKMDSVNLRWRRQIQENAKCLTFGDYLPEMNHNEINSWNFPTEVINNSVIVFIKDVDDNPRVKIRFDALKSLLWEKINIISVESNAQHFLTRMIDMIYLGDWVSFYMAVLSNTDPTPIPLISKLKAILADN